MRYKTGDHFKLLNAKVTSDYLRVSFGIFSVEKDLREDKISLIRLFGVKVYEATKKSTRKNEDFVLCDEILRRAIAINGEFDVYVSLIGSPSGEMYCFSNLVKQFTLINNISRYCLIVDSSWKKSLCSFLFRNICCVNIGKRIYIHDTLFYRDKDGHRLYNIFPTTHYLKQDSKLQQNNGFYYDEICKTLGAQPSPFPKLTVSNASIVRVDEYLEKNNINGSKFVIICPDANSCSELSEGLWDDIAKRLIAEGCIVFLNSNKKHTRITNNYSHFFSHEEMYYFASKACCVIGLRSGLLEILSTCGCDIVSIYSGLPERGLLDAMPAKVVFSGFSIKKLPGINKNKIHEYNLDEINVQALKNNILSFVLTNITTRTV